MFVIFILILVIYSNENYRAKTKKLLQRFIKKLCNEAEKPSQRYKIEDIFYVNLKEAVYPLSNKAFDICINSFNNNIDTLPYLSIYFVTKETYSKDDVIEIGNFILKKFKIYQTSRGLKFPCFIVSKSFNKEVYFYIYYMEFKTDESQYRFRYKIKLDESSNDVTRATDIYDKALEEEMKNVTETRVQS